jgi:hypothetical protein
MFSMGSLALYGSRFGTTTGANLSANQQPAGVPLVQVMYKLELSTATSLIQYKIQTLDIGHMRGCQGQINYVEE